MTPYSRGIIRFNRLVLVGAATVARVQGIVKGAETRLRVLAIERDVGGQSEADA